MKMQPKVSMIVPCYNKAKYIGRMLDSIIAQKWDNIEVILVNDGSTDGTGEVIASYEPKFLKRGFEVVIIDQVNHGVSTAVYNGLKRISGEFVCQVDADDELDPKYVVTLVTSLLKHPDYDWVVCDMLINQEKEAHYSFFRTNLPEDIILSSLVESFLFSQISRAVHEYMVRTDYIKQSRLVENFYYKKRGTQEAQFVLPLAAAGGKLKHIPEALYRHFENESSISLNDTFEKAVDYYKNYYEDIKGTIEKLTFEQHAKNRLFAISEIAIYMMFLHHASIFGVNNYEVMDVLDGKPLEFLKTAYPNSKNYTKYLLSDYHLFFQAVIDNVFNIPAIEINIPIGRIIAWGALGKNAKHTLPYLKGTTLEPTELWDISGDGIKAKKPDLASLTDNDLVLVLPAQKLANEIYLELEKTECATLSYDEIWKFIPVAKFPEFYDGSFKF